MYKITAAHDAETGVSLILETDPDSGHCDPTDPNNGDAAADIRFAVFHNRYTNPAERHGLRTVEDGRAFEAEADPAEWFVLPLWMYDHSGNVYRVGASNPFSCQWDSGRVGFVAIKRGEWGDNTDEGLAKVAETYAAEYTAWANGEVYGYTVTGPDGAEGDSCWGMIGEDYAKAQGLEAFAHAVKSARADLGAELEAARPDLHA